MHTVFANFPGMGPGERTFSRTFVRPSTRPRSGGLDEYQMLQLLDDGIVKRGVSDAKLKSLSIRTVDRSVHVCLTGNRFLICLFSPTLLSSSPACSRQNRLDHPISLAHSAQADRLPAPARALTHPPARTQASGGKGQVPHLPVRVPGGGPGHGPAVPPRLPPRLHPRLVPREPHVPRVPVRGRGLTRLIPARRPGTPRLQPASVGETAARPQRRAGRAAAAAMSEWMRVATQRRSIAARTRWQQPHRVLVAWWWCGGDQGCSTDALRRSFGSHRCRARGEAVSIAFA